MEPVTSSNRLGWPDARVAYRHRLAPCGATSRSVRTFVCRVAEQFRRSACAAEARARATGRPVLAWVAEEAPRVDPIDVLELAAELTDDHVLWESVTDGFGLVGIGSAWRVEASGPDRFRRAARAWRSLLETLPPGASKAGPRLGPCPVGFGGFAFGPECPTDHVWNGYPAGCLSLPRVTAVSTADRSWLAVAGLVAPHGGTSGDLGREVDRGLNVWAEALAPGECRRADNRPQAADLVLAEFPTAQAWRRIVRDTVHAIRGQAFRKAVIARGVRVRAARLDPAGALRGLRRAYPECTLFAVGRRGRCFFGATPERLVRLRDGAVDVTALAGSAPRGATEREDERIAARLLGGAKDRLEHQIVVESLRRSLSSVCAGVSSAVDPVVLRLPNVQHLATPISGVLRGPCNALDLVGRLHPSPAVGGAPRDQALRWIRVHEGWDRGWYAGPIGWIDASGSGEFAVAIRSALVRGGEARVFAGCGIVAESDPESEYAESCLKLQPLLAALARGG